MSDVTKEEWEATLIADLKELGINLRSINKIKLSTDKDYQLGGLAGERLGLVLDAAERIKQAREFGISLVEIKRHPDKQELSNKAYQKAKKELDLLIKEEEEIIRVYEFISWYMENVRKNE